MSITAEFSQTLAMCSGWEKKYLGQHGPTTGFVTRACFCHCESDFLGQFSFSLLPFLVPSSDYSASFLRIRAEINIV